MKQEQLTTPELALFMDNLKYYPLSTITQVTDALREAEYESQFCTDAISDLQDLIDDIQSLITELSEAEKIIQNKLKVHI